MLTPSVGLEGPTARPIGRYVLYDEIAAGGMATVHLGRLVGPVGFARTVAIKRLHPHYAKDPEFVAMFLDEARLAARIRHPNVVATIDVVATEGELFLVMEYVQGESLARLMRPTRNVGRVVPAPIAIAIAIELLYGLHGAHEAHDELGVPLSIVHRDVSPQNALVGIDGVTRVLDFGIAKATSRIATTRDGQLKGKVAYMSPEQLTHRPVDRRADVFAASIVLWEMLTGERLFFEDDVGAVMARVMHGEVVPPSTKIATLPKTLDAIVLRGLARDPEARFSTAKDMATALEELGPARAAQVGAWVESLAGSALQHRAGRLREIERDTPGEGANAGAGAGAGAGASADMPTQMLADPAPALSLPLAAEPIETEPLDPPHPPRRGRAVLALVAIAALVVFGAGAAFIIVTRHRDEPAPSPSSAPLASPPVSPSPTGSVIASASAPPFATSASTSPTVASASASLVPTRPLPVRPPTAVPKKSPSSGKPNCDPPFFIDDQGVKRFKPGCV